MKLISRILSQKAIGIRDGFATCLKGKVMGRTLSDVGSLTSQAGIVKGEIWVAANGRIRFSAEIPEQLHQRLRNVIASD